MKISKKELKKIIKEELEDITLGSKKDPSALNAFSNIQQRPGKFQGSSTAATLLTDLLGDDALRAVLQKVPDNWEGEKAEAIQIIKSELLASLSGTDRLGKLILSLLHDMSERDIPMDYYEKNIEVPAGLEEKRAHKKSKK